MDEHFTSHMEQGNGESHTLPHEEHHYQENYLEGYTNTGDLMKSLKRAMELGSKILTQRPFLSYQETGGQKHTFKSTFVYFMYFVKP